MSVVNEEDHRRKVEESERVLCFVDNFLLPAILDERFRPARNAALFPAYLMTGVHQSLRRDPRAIAAMVCDYVGRKARSYRQVQWKSSKAYSVLCQSEFVVSQPEHDAVLSWLEAISEINGEDWKAPSPTPSVATRSTLQAGDQEFFSHLMDLVKARLNAVNVDVVESNSACDELSPKEMEALRSAQVRVRAEKPPTVKSVPSNQTQTQKSEQSETRSSKSSDPISVAIESGTKPSKTVSTQSAAVELPSPAKSPARDSSSVVVELNPRSSGLVHQPPPPLPLPVAATPMSGAVVVPQKSVLPPPPSPPPVPKLVLPPVVKLNAEVITTIKKEVSARDAEVVADEVLRTAEEFKAKLADKLPLAFEEFRPKGEAFVLVPPDTALSDTWFIGDIHGDLLALEAILYHIDASSKGDNATIIFLGDLFDDGPFGDRAVLRVMRLMLDRPGRIAMVVGNHDEAMGYNSESGDFTSLVSPSEFTDSLNKLPKDSPWRTIGQAAVELFKRLPRAILLADGLLVAHGGVPHSDLQKEFSKREDLEEDRFKQDFVWTRAHDSVKKRIPNRSSKGCSFGIEDFDGFCSKASQILGRPVARMIRGHDHMENRYQLYEKYVNHPMLTINAMCYRQRDLLGPYVRVPCVARWARGELPEVHRIEVPADVVTAVYPPPTEA